MKQAVDQFTSRHQLLEPGDKVVAAVSGGPDSMAMLHYLSRLPLEISVLHIHHQLRTEADEEAELVKRTAEKFGFPFFLRRVDVKTLMQEEGTGVQQTARTARYHIFEEIMEEAGAVKTATAHHGDDQIETMVMRFTRGSIQGMKGIPARRKLGYGEVIRPLLAVTKQEIEDYCSAQQIPYRIDVSNESTNYMRSRIRSGVLPALKKENPRLHEAAQWQAEIREEEDSFLNKLAEAELASVLLEKKKESLLTDRRAFASIPSALQKRVVHLLLTYLQPHASWTRVHIQSVEEVYSGTGKPNAFFSAHGLLVERTYDTVCIRRHLPEAESSWEPREAVIPSRTELPHGTVIADTNFLPGTDASVVLSVSREELPLTVRTRKPGDRVRTKAGTKKLKKIFIDEKIPAKEREEWPIITNRHGTILWVPFLCKAERNADSFQNNQQTVHLAYIKSRTAGETT